MHVFVCRKRHIKVERGLEVGRWVVYGVDVFGLRAVEGEGGITRKPHHHISHLCRYKYIYKYKYRPMWEKIQNILIQIQIQEIQQQGWVSTC